MAPSIHGVLTGQNKMPASKDYRREEEGRTDRPDGKRMPSIVRLLPRFYQHFQKVVEHREPSQPWSEHHLGQEKMMVIRPIDTEPETGKVGETLAHSTPRGWQHRVMAHSRQK